MTLIDDWCKLDLFAFYKAQIKSDRKTEDVEKII